MVEGSGPVSYTHLDVYKRQGKNPFTLDSKAPTGDYQEFLMGEVRYASLAKANPSRAEKLFDKSQSEAVAKYAYLQKLQKMYEPEA